MTTDSFTVWPDIMRTYCYHRGCVGKVLTAAYRFLDLMATSPSTFLVPTLDIDLAWHTHQLMGDKYHHDCMRYVNRYIDQYV